MNLSNYLLALFIMLVVSVFFWVISVIKKDVSIVDSLWSLFFIIASVTTYFMQDEPSLRASIVLLMVIIWAVRLSLHITVRHWGHGEDHRYQTIRENNQPGFKYKSLYLIFIFQAVIALIVAMPLFSAIESTSVLGVFDLVAIILWTVGMFFESTADYQLYKFKKNPANKGKIMTSGLWKYSRHPNYFGECLIWWGFFSFALAGYGLTGDGLVGGALVTIISPIIMTLLLLKFSGVNLLESTLKCRPGYEAYMKNTNAFIPGPVVMTKNIKQQDVM